MKIAVILVLAACARAHLGDEKNEGGRQKRLLFFDEEGSLVKTYSNPYLKNLALKSEQFPHYGNIYNPFFNFIQALGHSLAAFTIPVSNAVVQQIRNDPAFQNSLVVVPKNPVVEPNQQCEGKRTQVPSPLVCNNFLNCWDGWAVEQECPAGLLFSSAGYCDYADNVDCLNRKVDEEKLQPQLQPRCNKDFDTFRNKLNCNEFFVCVNRQPVKFNCPADLAYNQVLGICDYADRVDCKSDAAPASPPFKPNIPSSTINLPLPAPSPSGPLLIPQITENPVLPLPVKPALPLPVKPALPLPVKPVLPLPIKPALTDKPTAESPSNFPFDKIPSKPDSSYLAPGSSDIPSSPMIPPETSNVRPSFVKPSPPANELDFAPASTVKPGSEPFTPGCAHPNVAMSRQDAIRQLQGQTY